jgi:hypothetical protein
MPYAGSWQSLIPTYYEQTPLPISGLAMYYADNVMDGVIRYRQRSGSVDDCQDCVGQVALLRAGDLNRRVWIRLGDGKVEGPFQVTDVAARHHVPSLLRRGWAVDVDYDTAMRWGMRGPVPVTIYSSPPATVSANKARGDG